MDQKDKIGFQLFKEANVYKVIYLGFIFSLLQCAYSSFQEFLTLIMSQEDKLILANLSLGGLYLVFCLSEFFLSPYIFSIYKGKQRHFLFSIATMTFVNLILAFANVINCSESFSQAFYCTDYFLYPYCLISALFCGIGGSALWLTQGIYITKCCRPWNRGRFSGLFFLAFNTSLISGNFMGYYILRNGYVIFYYLVTVSVVLTASLLFLTVKQPEAPKKTLIGETIIFEQQNPVLNKWHVKRQKSNFFRQSLENQNYQNRKNQNNKYENNNFSSIIISNEDFDNQSMRSKEQVTRSFSSNLNQNTKNRIKNNPHSLSFNRKKKPQANNQQSIQQIQQQWDKQYPDFNSNNNDNQSKSQILRDKHIQVYTEIQEADEKEEYDRKISKLTNQSSDNTHFNNSTYQKKRQAIKDQQMRIQQEKWEKFQRDQLEYEKNKENEELLMDRVFEQERKIFQQKQQQLSQEQEEEIDGLWEDENFRRNMRLSSKTVDFHDNIYNLKQQDLDQNQLKIDEKDEFKKEIQEKHKSFHQENEKDIKVNSKINKNNNMFQMHSTNHQLKQKKIFISNMFSDSFMQLKKGGKIESEKNKYKKSKKNKNQQQQQLLEREQMEQDEEYEYDYDEEGNLIYDDNMTTINNQNVLQQKNFFQQLLDSTVFTEEHSLYNFVVKNKFIRNKKVNQQQFLEQSFQYNQSMQQQPQIQQSQSFNVKKQNNQNFNQSQNDEYNNQQSTYDDNQSNYSYKFRNTYEENIDWIQNNTFSINSSVIGGSMAISNFEKQYNQVTDDPNQKKYAKDGDILSYGDLFLFLRRNKQIRNLIPSYILSGLFFGFWQKLGPIIVQYRREQEMKIEYKNIYDETGRVFIVAGIVQFIFGPIFGFWFDRSSRKNRRRIMIFLVSLVFITIIIFPLPFLDTEFFVHGETHNTGLVMFSIIGVLFGLQNCGMNITGGPIRSWTFNREKLLVLSFATYRLVYYLSVACAFFITIGIPYKYVPFLIPVILLIFTIWTVKTLLINHKF